MREIKFRAWDKKVKRLSNPFGVSAIAITWNDGDIEMPALFATTDPERFDLMQYTGLLDKNGVEIYEGDIVTDDSLVDDYGTPFKAEVVFKDAMFRYGHRNCDCGDCEESPLWAEHEAIHVIGNIYDNPELLNNAG